MASLGFSDGVFHNLLGSKLADMGADKVGALLDQAAKGVVFVDECYQLDPKGAAGAAGQKVLERIMDHSEGACVCPLPLPPLLLTPLRRRLPVSRHERTSTVIFAGYEGPVRDVISSNQGMARRFQHTVVFDDYTEVEIRRSERCSRRRRLAFLLHVFPPPPPFLRSQCTAPAL